MASKVEIPLSGSSLTIVKKCGRALGDVIHSKFGCVATFDSVDFESDRSIAQKKKPTVVPQKIFSDTLNNGIEVSVWKADLTTFQVDAVVNAANTKLQHGGGLALALSEAGGVQIQRHSNAYIRKHKELDTGKAIIADAWSLPCNKIIHAVGPQLSRYNPDVRGAEPLLRKTIKSILDIVRDHHLDTVAIPAISSGIFNYPLNKCAETIVSTVKQYYDYNSSRGHCPKEIQFVNNDEPTVRAMEKACLQILQSQMTMSYSQAAGSRSTGAAKTSTPAVRIGNVTLTLKKGNIEEQQTDVIVNTVSRERNLNTGEISRAILKKAGTAMQKEIDLASWSSHVITTRSYNLSCNEVYHTCIEPGKNVQQILYKAASECLYRAAKTQYKSISFPAIGTGGLSLRKEEVAMTMSKAVADFARNTRHMMDVYFVIYAFDSTFKAFEEQIQRLHENESSPSFTSALEPRDDLRDTKPPSPQISLISGFVEVTLEANRWLSDLLFKPSRTVHIYNNFIQHFGEQEYQQLSRLTQNSISIEESFVNGHACITVMGNSHEDVVVAELQVEAMLLNIQMKFATEEEDTMLNALGKLEKVGFERRTVIHSGPLFSDISLHCKQQKLQVVKVEKVVNPALDMVFNLKKKQLLNTSLRTMFQRIPAQFCEMVCRTGFHVEYAPPEDPAYGEGIYFAHSIEAAMELWKYQNEEYVYLVEAEVLTGVSTRGKPGLILPPAQGTDPSFRYDSVNGGTEVTVVFSTYQAQPKHIITCKLVKSDSFTVSSFS